MGMASGGRIALSGGLVGRVFGRRWEIIDERPLGKGGQGTTYKVKDLTGALPSPCALKCLNVDNERASRLDRFRIEVEAIQAIDHSGVLKLVDSYLEGDSPYMVSEYCNGGSLEDSWSIANAGPDGAFNLFIKICDAIAAVHSKGYVHRDIKPSNILLRGLGGDPVVADFGICYVAGGERRTLGAEIVGTRNYTAPEFEDGRAENPTPAADVYSLGKLLYWMLNPRPMFSREKQRDEQFDLVHVSQDARYEHVNRLLDQMIHPEPGGRLPNGAAVGKQARELARLWRGGYNALSPNLASRCTFCGQGYYTNLDPQAIGIQHAQVRVLWCRTCGHTQTFRIVGIDHPEWWGPGL